MAKTRGQRQFRRRRVYEVVDGIEGALGKGLKVAKRGPEVVMMPWVAPQLEERARRPWRDVPAVRAGGGTADTRRPCGAPLYFVRGLNIENIPETRLVYTLYSITPPTTSSLLSSKDSNIEHRQRTRAEVGEEGRAARNVGRFGHETPIVLLPMYIGVGSKSIDRGAAGSEVTGGVRPSGMICSCWIVLSRGRDEAS